MAQIFGTNAHVLTPGAFVPYIAFWQKGESNELWKKGVRSKQKELNSKTKKLGRKLALTLVKLALAAIIGMVICGVSAGIGAFKGILSSTPEIHLSDVVATGEATIVYDCEGNELDQYVSINSNRIQINNMDLIPKHLGRLS